MRAGRLRIPAGWSVAMLAASALAAAAAPPASVVRGAVTDAETRRPIARFRLVPASLHADGQPGMWQPHLIKTFTGGLYETKAHWQQTRFRVDADGYRPAVSRVVRTDEGEVVLHFALRRDPGLLGTVRAPDGTPVAGARLLHATASREASVEDGRLSVAGFGQDLGAAVVETGPDGGFRLPAEVDPGLVVAAHEEHGYAEVTPEALAARSVVTLKAWGRVEGRVLAAAVPVAGRLVWLGGSRPSRDYYPSVHHSAETTTDASGRFAFGRAAPGRSQLSRTTPTADGGRLMVWGTTAWVDVRDGQTTRITLGGEGRPVIGRVRDRSGRKPPVDWTRFSLRLFPSAPHIGLPGDDDDWREYGRFAGTAEGRRYFRDDQPIRADGTFRLEGVPQGRFSILIRGPAPATAGSKPAVENESELATGRGFELPATADGRIDEPLDLGDIDLPAPRAGR